MEIIGVSSALWSAAQAITIEQIALNALIGLAVTVALFVLVRAIAPETASQAQQSLVNTYNSWTTPRRLREVSDEISSDPAPARSENNDTKDYRLRKVSETATERWENNFRLARSPQQKSQLIIDIVNWLEGSREGDKTDVDKIRSQLEGYLKTLTKSSWSDFLEHLKEHSMSKDNIIKVKGDGNCGYYAAAGRLLLMGVDLTSKLDNPSHNFIDLAAQLRAKAFDLARGDLGGWGEALLSGVVETWVEGLLRSHYSNVKSMAAGGSKSSNDCNDLMESLSLTAEEASDIHNIIMEANPGNDVFEEGLASPVVLACINVKGEQHFKDLYKEKISQHADGERPGFWASPFELYLLAQHFEVPLRIIREGESDILLNAEDSSRALWLEVKYNGRDHFDMVVPE